jgi:hypothetical protein
MGKEMKHISIAFTLFVLLQMTSFGQMLKFPKQNADSSYKVSFLLTNQNNQLFFWFSGAHLLQSRSTDGINWSDAIVVKDSVPASDYYQSEITGVVLNTGRIYLVFKYNIYYSIYSDNNGQTWSAPIKIPTGTIIITYSRAQKASITQSSTGKLILLYTEVFGTSNSIRFITSSDNGTTWSSEQIFATGSLQASISATANSKLMIVYQNKGLFSSFSTDDGVTWDSSKTIISSDTNVNTPKVVKDETGKLWLFYSRIVPTPFQGIWQQDIMYKTSSDNGLTWSAETNFTKYKGFDGYFNVSTNGNNPWVSFSSDRYDSAHTIYNLWYGTAGITNDNNAPSCVYKYAVSNPTPKAGEQINIDIYLDYVNNAPTVTLNRTIGGTVQPPLTMYDDGTHGDTIANDKIYSCEMLGLAIGDVMMTDFIITDQQSSSFIYKGPEIIIPLNNSINATVIDVNRFKLPVDNKGVLADLSVNNEIGGGKYDGNIVLFSAGFFLSGITSGNLWSNGNFSAARVSDYVPGRVGIIPEDPKNLLSIVKSTDSPFGQAWQDWKIAVSQGASFYDGNHDGVYNPVDLNGNGKWDPNEDRPDLLGDMTTWCVYNDGVPTAQRVFNDVSPQGIEIQQTAFAQKDSADLNNVVFVRYRIINRGTVADVLDSVYFGSLYDMDIGDSGANDLAGCDTLLNSVYTYHQIGAGDGKWGNNPPAEAATLLQGPISYIPGITFTDINSNGIYDQGTDIPIDTAFSIGGPLLGKTIYPGAKNLAMTSANEYFKSTEPSNRLQARYTLLGRNITDGTLFDPCTWYQGQVLGGVNCADVNPLYLYSGDPITQTGWINNGPRDQRNIINTGPFKLEKNKPVDIIIANIVGRGSDNLNSITIAKNYAANVIKYYNLNFPNSILTGVRDIPQVINNFNLSQNYPNPFNPSTRIKYSISSNSFVSIKVYNILGKEVALLLNEQKNPGEYEFIFNSGRYNLASGVYFYKLTARGFASVKKMVLLK